MRCEGGCTFDAADLTQSMPPVFLPAQVRHSVKWRWLLPLCAFPFLAVTDLWCIYNEVKSVQLKTLNRERWA